MELEETESELPLMDIWSPWGTCKSDCRFSFSGKYWQSDRKVVVQVHMNWQIKSKGWSLRLAVIVETLSSTRKY